MVPDSALAACQILLHNTKKEQIFLSADVPPVRSPPVWPCEGLCGLLWEGAESPVPLPADTGRIWAAVPPFRRNAYSGHVPPPNRFARDEKKSRIKTGVAGGSSGRSLRPAVRVVSRNLAGT